MLWLGPWGHQHSVLVRVDSDLYLTEMHLVAYLFQGLGVAAAALDIVKNGGMLKLLVPETTEPSFLPTLYL